MAKGFENATSLDRFLNRSVLFVQGIDPNVPKPEVLQALNQVMKAPQQGRIDVLTTPEGKMRGTAFLNFYSSEEAKAALGKWRFSLEVRGRHLRMQYSSDREFKEVIQGPAMARFKILVRNLPEDLTHEAIFDMFSEYGEILQVHTSCDQYGQHYAIVNYVEAASVQTAIRNAHRQKVLSHVILVEQYKPNATYGILPRNINQMGPPQAAAAAGGTGGGSPNSGGGSTLPGTTYAALQQQQEREMAVQQQRQAAAAAAHQQQHRYSENGGAAAGVMSNGQADDAATAAPPPPAAAAVADQGSGLAVPGFYAAAAAAAAAAAGPLQPPTAPGSLRHLLSTALHHIHALEEHLCCPITTEPLVDPVVAADGNTYERVVIEAWLQQHDTSPLTNEVLPHKALTPNNLLRKIAEELQGVRHSDADANGGGGAPAAATPAAAADLAPATAADAAVGVPAAAAPVAAEEVVVEHHHHGHVPVPVPVPISVQPQQLTQQQQQPAYHHHAVPQQQQQQQQQQQHTYQQHHQHHPAQQQQQQVQQVLQPQQQQYDYGRPVALVRPQQLVAAPVAFVHTIQPQQQHPQQQHPQPFQVQVQGGTTYYTHYRPMGM